MRLKTVDNPAGKPKISTVASSDIGGRQILTCRLGFKKFN